MRSLLRGFFACSAVIALFGIEPGVGLAQEVEVGVTAAVNPTTSSVSQTYGQRTLVIGYDVVFGERITTTDQGQAQILFIDESSLTIGPSSDIVIDAFVFDPEASSGRLAASLTKGVFRYVGGQISKTTPVELKTPTAALSIRGGVALFQVDGGTGATTAIFVYGEELTVDTAAGNSTRLQRPGYKVTVLPNGVLTDIAPATPDEIAGALGALEGRAGQTGGASEQPTNSRIAETAIVALGSGVDPADIAIDVVRAVDVIAELPTATPIEDEAKQTEGSQDLAGEDASIDVGGSDIDLDLLSGFLGLEEFGFLPLPDTGTATLTGIAFGSVDDNGAIRAANGDMSLTANFATRNGTLSITNFDGRNFGGTLTDTGAGNDYFGEFTGSLADTDSGAPLSGSTEGVIFRFDNGGPTNATVGSFEVGTGAGYTATGAYIGTDDGSFGP